VTDQPITNKRCHTVGLSVRSDYGCVFRLCRPLAYRFEPFWSGFHAVPRTADSVIVFDLNETRSMSKLREINLIFKSEVGI